ncbi:vacuolar cation/proton exchanger 3 isoform X3 [Amborella trichopoda]|uniref:vacuolar cation/proton exchanger 3 isoform X3 n=1 Tax=Amborella trichopoda TaxID=13333 RepID=UPI0009C142CF|nr:vacuolar cation/proton exchanger 3 isoform X3 [Amborella trichopoda]|eukprot:XP_020525140.1 vacuolar cation/proton exchanger 3 isoform X3 [Amborella trichopoda]
MASKSIIDVENGGNLKGLSREIRHGRTAHNMSSSSLRKKSDVTLLQSVQIGVLRKILANLQEVILGTKLAFLFVSVPVAIVAEYCNFGHGWVFILSLLGLIPLAERVSFLTEQIAFFTGPTVGGLLNATCGNATELIIAFFALASDKIVVVKCSLLGSVLSNLLLVLGTSLFCGGLVNLRKEQRYDRTQADANSGLLILGTMCLILPLLFKYADPSSLGHPALDLSRASSIIMLISYGAYLFFQLKTHRQLFEPQEDDDGDEEDSQVEEAVIGWQSGVAWLVVMTATIALLSEYVVKTIESAANSWDISVSFISVILLPIVGNAAEHAGAIIFAVKNKLDITLGVAMGSASQISMFVVPLTVVVAWMMGKGMDLDFGILETVSLFISVVLAAFMLQTGDSHYMKGFILLLSYLVIGACLFVLKTPLGAAAKTFTAPLDRIKLLMQTHGIRAVEKSQKQGIGFVEAITMIGKEEGLKGFWKGNLPQVIRIIPYTVVQLFSYEVYKKLFRREDGELSVVGRLAAGACAGMTSTLGVLILVRAPCPWAPA